MSELIAGPAGVFPRGVEFSPSDIARRRITTWNGIRTDTVQVVRNEPFEYGLRAPHHVLIMTERAVRDDGETLLERLPKSSSHKSTSHKPTSHKPTSHKATSQE